MTSNKITSLNQVTPAVFTAPTAPAKVRGFFSKPDPVAQAMYRTEVKYALEAHENLMEHKKDMVASETRSRELGTMQSNITRWYREAYAESADDPELHAILMSTVKIGASIEQERYVRKHAPAQQWW